MQKFLSLAKASLNPALEKPKSKPPAPEKKDAIFIFPYIQLILPQLIWLGYLDL